VIDSAVVDWISSIQCKLQNLVVLIMTQTRSTEWLPR